jgi:PHP family Zn ribbon phosphoesterase
MTMLEVEATCDRVIRKAQEWRIPTPIGVEPILTYACAKCGTRVSRIVIVDGEANCERCGS